MSASCYPQIRGLREKMSSITLAWLYVFCVGLPAVIVGVLHNKKMIDISPFVRLTCDLLVSISFFVLSYVCLDAAPMSKTPYMGYIIATAAALCGILTAVLSISRYVSVKAATALDL
jgi:hypothetical protein